MASEISAEKVLIDDKDARKAAKNADQSRLQTLAHTRDRQSGLEWNPSLLTGKKEANPQEHTF